MTRHIDADAAKIRDPYALFGALLDLVDDEHVAVMAQHAGQLHTGRLEGIARDRLTIRQRARHQATLSAATQVR